jgi:hypothetical protein
VTDAHHEGWYTDPFARHEARWMSDGTPTKLVRDGDEESYEDPPDEEPSVTPSPIAEHQNSDGSDLFRADDAGAGESLNDRLHDAGQFGSTWGSHIALPPEREAT